MEITFHKKIVNHEYTSMETMIKITSDNVIWATKGRFKSDPEDMISYQIAKTPVSQISIIELKEEIDEDCTEEEFNSFYQEVLSKAKI